MNFELAERLYALLEINKPDEAIALAEMELKNISETDLHKITGKDLELFREAYKESKGEWTQIPMFVTAHDYDLIYRVR